MICRQLFSFMRSVHQNCGHRFIDTAELCTTEIHNILWACLDLKAHVKNHHPLGKPLKDKKVTMLCSCQSNCTNLIVQSAMKNLGADLHLMLASRWEQSKFKTDIGRLYSLYSDVIVAQGDNHRSLCELTKGSSVPVINISSHKFVPIHGLAVLMTLQEYFGRLSGLKMGWVGPMGNKLNTLIYLLPKVGIDLQYNCEPKPKFPGSPIVLPAGKAFCETFNTRIESCSDPLETIRGVDVVVTAKHKTKTVQIDMKMFDNANSNWLFLHLLPRWQGDVCEEVFNHKNSLVWTLHENIQYPVMAVVLDLLKGYKPITAKPNFG